MESNSVWLEIVSLVVCCWFKTIRPLSLDGEAISVVDNLVSISSIAFTVEVSLVTKLVLLDLLLGRLSKGWSKGLIGLVDWPSKLVSNLSNYLPIVFKHWFV